jgi:hypothetical protein
MGSITRTIDELLGLSAMNLEDALAGEITGIFAEHPHLTPYAVRPSDPRVFSSARARLARPKNKQEAELLKDMDDADEIRKEVEKSSANPHMHKD